MESDKGDAFSSTERQKFKQTKVAVVFGLDWLQLAEPNPKPPSDSADYHATCDHPNNRHHFCHFAAHRP